MRTFQDKTFEHFDDRNSRASYSGLSFQKCFFRNCVFSVTTRPALRSRACNVEFIDCEQQSCSLWPAIVEDVLIDGFKTHGQLFQTWGAVFKHVVLKGKIDRLMISGAVLPSLLISKKDRQAELAAFAKANIAYYESVDWALDISQGEFKELEIRGIPGRLIRRDPETQILVTRETAMRGEWRKLKFRTNVTSVCFNLFLDRQDTDMLFVAEKRNPHFRDDLADLQLLRKSGIAEPD